MRKRSDNQPSEQDQSGSGMAIAVGALIDGIPESIVLGLGLIAGGAVSPTVLAGDELRVVVEVAVRRRTAGVAPRLCH